MRPSATLQHRQETQVELCVDIEIAPVPCEALVVLAGAERHPQLAGPGRCSRYLRRFDPGNPNPVVPQTYLVSATRSTGNSPGPVSTPTQEPFDVEVQVSPSRAALAMMGAPAESIGEDSVPTVHRFGPYRFYFYSKENLASHEAAHIHVASADHQAVFWLDPVSLRTNHGYTPREIERLRRIVTANRALLRRHWDEFFNHPPG